MSGSLADTAALEKVMQALGSLLHRQYQFVPDAILVLRGPDGEHRASFAANQRTLQSGRDLRQEMTKIFLSALGQNDMLVEEALKLKQGGGGAA